MSGAGRRRRVPFSLRPSSWWWSQLRRRRRDRILGQMGRKGPSVPCRVTLPGANERAPPLCPTSPSTSPPLEWLPVKPRDRKDGDSRASRTTRLRWPGESSEVAAGGGGEVGAGTGDGVETGGRQGAASRWAVAVTVSTGAPGLETAWRGQQAETASRWAGSGGSLAPVAASAFVRAGPRRWRCVGRGCGSVVVATMMDGCGSADVAGLRLLGWSSPRAWLGLAEASSAGGRSRGSWAVMRGCGVGGTTACIGMKQEWGLMSAAVISSLSAKFSPSFWFPPFFGWTLFWSWGTLGGGRRLRLAVGVCSRLIAFRGWPRACLCRWLRSRYD
uniref:Uncharacterized protein n=1 Tax=Oryza meridionalis TaxID=40149 RepID=A0A0E0DC77_9ORYZ